MRLASIAFAMFALCCGHDVPPQHLEPGDWALYIEAKSPEGHLTGSFGDVTLLRIQDGKKFYVTRDSYYDDEPCLSGDKRFIAFRSNRTRSNLLRRVQGVLGGTLFIYDIEHRTTRSLSITPPKSDTGDINHGLGIQWVGQSNQLAYFVNGEGFFLYDISADTTNCLLRTSKYSNSFWCSPSGALGAIQLERRIGGPGEIAFEIYLIDLSTKRAGVVVQRSRAISLGGWTSDSKRFLFADSLLHEYNIESKTERTLQWTMQEFLPDSVQGFYWGKRCFYGANGTLIYQIHSTDWRTMTSNVVQFDTTLGVARLVTKDNPAIGCFKVY